MTRQNREDPVVPFADLGGGELYYEAAGKPASLGVAVHVFAWTRDASRFPGWQSALAAVRAFIADHAADEDSVLACM
jgi:hypothetical protein